MSIKKQVIEGFGWNFGASQVLLVARFFVGIALARILMPEDFGKFAYMNSIITMLFILRGFGFDSYVVQCDKDKLRVFGGTAVLLNGVLCIAVFFIALAVGIFGVEREFFLMFLVLLVFHAVENLLFVFHSFIQKELLYKKMALLNFFSSIFSMATGVLLAFQGFGIWSLIWMTAVRSATSVLLSIIYSPYYTKPVFSAAAAKDTWNYGKYNMLASFTGVSFSHTDNIIVERSLGTVTLGFYSRAYSLARIFNQVVGSVVVRVAGPLFSKFKYERDKLSRIYNDFSTIMFRVNLGFYLILGCVAPDFIELVYTAKWLPAVPAIRMFLIFALLNPLVGMTRRAFLNTGRSKPVGIAQVVLVGVLLITLVPLIKLFGLLGAAIAVNISIIACFVLMIFFLNKILDANFKQILIKPVFVALLIALIYLLTNRIFLPERSWLRLLTHSVIIGGLYVGGIILMERAYLAALLKEIKLANA